VYLAIGVPTYGHITQNFYNFSNELITLLNNLKIPYIFLNKEGALICRARNEIMTGFYDLAHGNTGGGQYQGLTHFLFLDCDVSADPRHIIEMMYHTRTYNIDLIGAFVPLKDFDGGVLQKTRAFVLCQDGREVYLDSEQTLQDVDILTTGMLLFTREMVDALVQDAADSGEWYHYTPENKHPIYNIFRTPIITEERNGEPFRHYLSEDWHICYKARELGYRVICDRSVNVKHRGHHDFRFPNREDYEHILRCEEVLQGSCQSVV